MNEQQAKTTWQQFKPILSCTISAVLMIAAVDFIVANSFVVNLDAFLETINAIVATFEGFASKVSWRPWFYLMGTAGFSMCCLSIKQNKPEQALLYLVGTLVLGLVSFMMLNHADPGRVHRYTVYLTAATMLCAVTLVAVFVCRATAWKELSNDDKSGVIMLGGIVVCCSIVVLILSLEFQTKIAEMAEVSTQVEQKYGAELRAMKFETFYNYEKCCTDQWKTIAVDGETLEIEREFNLLNPEDEQKYLVERGFSFEIGMVDNKPVVMIGKIDWDNYPRDLVIRSVNNAVERAIKQIREAYTQVENNKANRKGWRERIFEVKDPV